ncbi:MAG: hypothetical protein ACWA5A_12475 [Marinibacterium sp.]
MELTETGLRSGVWQGELTGASGNGDPRIIATHLDQPVDGVEILARGGGAWQIRVPVPDRAISDGVHTIVISDAQSGTKLAHFTLIAGAPAADDIRAEIDLLRAELDMLKRAFRRHCVETA